MATSFFISALILIIGFILYIIRQQRIREMKRKNVELRKWCILQYSNLIDGDAVAYAEKLYRRIQSSPNKETMIDIIPFLTFVGINECARIAHYIDTGIIPPEPSQSLKQPPQSASQSIDYS